MIWAIGMAIGFLKRMEMDNKEFKVKKYIKILLTVLAVVMIPFGVGKMLETTKASADDLTVYVSSTGNDEAVGTADAPYQTLEKALSIVEDGATIVLKDTVAINGWNGHDKTITITGGALDASGMADIFINDNVTFTNMTWKVDNNAEIYANGNTVVMGENVTISGSNVYLYGGSDEGSTIDSTDLTVLSGTYGYIFGGSHGVSGNTATINRDTNLTIGGTTSASYVFGGANGSSDIFGTSYLRVTGGTFEGAYGGNQGTNAGNDVDMEITGGEFVQVFGGGHSAYLTGTVNMRLLGGTITRRVYGGCYNDASGTSFKTNCYVNGKIYLTIGGGVDIDFSSNESDRGIYARTRHKTEVNTETAILTFADEIAYNKYKDKLGAQDWGGQLLMGSLTAADELHYYTYAQEGMTITQTCVYCDDFIATATMVFDESVSLLYTGEAKEPATVVYSDNWVGEKPQVAYTDNVEAGIAKCALTIGQVCVEMDFIIVEAPTVLGGSVRLSNPTGLRFQSMLPAGLKDSGATFGTLIIPKEVLGGSELTHATPLVEDIVQTKWATSEVQISNPLEYQEGYEYFNAVLTEIPSEYYDAEIVARSYVYANGQYYYSQQITRSAAQVAAYALEDGYTSSVLYTYVDEALKGVTLTMESEVDLWETGETEYQLVLEGNVNNYAVIWTSSNNDVVTVDKNGKLTVGGAQGRAIITAKLGSRILKCTVIVERKWSNYY